MGYLRNTPALGRGWLGRARLALVVVMVLLAVGCGVGVGTASAESLCTDSWTGPYGEEWGEAADWSGGHVPTSSDVACIGAHQLVRIRKGVNVTGVLQGEGELELRGGSLEVANALETSRISSFSMSGSGVLTGAGTLVVVSAFEWGVEGTGAMTGSGKTVIGPGVSSGRLNESGGGLSERVLVNEGTLAFGGSLVMSEGAKIENEGTFLANSEDVREGEGADIAVAPGSKLQPSIVNTGLFEKSSASRNWGTSIAVDFVNEGIVKLIPRAAYLVFSGGGSSSASSEWVVSEVANLLLQGASSYSMTGTTWTGPGTFEVRLGASVTASGLHSASANVVLRSEGTLDVASGVMAVASLLIDESTLTGAGTLDVASTLDWKEGFAGAMTGPGKTVLEPGATGAIYVKHAALSERKLVNEGDLSLESGYATIVMSAGATLENIGTFEANSEYEKWSEGAQIVGESSDRIVNFGIFEKTSTDKLYTSGVTEVAVAFENYGETGSIPFAELWIDDPVEAEEPTLWGGEANPSAPEQNTAICGEDVSCAKGNLSKQQSDFAIGGRGVGLDLERTYNSQAAASGSKGIFGYGWSNSFNDHLVFEPSSKRVVLVQANGSSVPFTEEGASLIAPAWSQDTLSGSKAAGYTLTLENQTVYKFAGASGRLESVTDRDGNATTLTYSEAGLLERITDPAGRAIKLAYNGEGLVESATDPMGHVVEYAYEGGNLATVTQPGEAGIRWRLKYDASHQLTELTDGRGNIYLYEYNKVHQVSGETDPLKRATTFEYTPFRTVTTNSATGSVTVNWATSTGQSAAVTHGYGTALATTESFTYDAAGNELSRTDGDGHTTRYTYDSHGNRTSMVDPTSHETKWTYNGTHDVETETKPGGETTTYIPSNHNPKTVERPAPKSQTQSTSYEYNAHGQLTSVTDPLKRTWKYEYDTAGDKTAEIDPEGDKRTWGYNEDSQETTSVSPRGHVSGAKEASFTTKTERDAQGRPIKLTDPLGHETTLKYDADGNLEVKTDPELHVTTYTYDADDERTMVKEPNEVATETGYDGAGQVISQTDGRKHTTKYVRNVLEQITENVDQLGRKTLKEYDLAGNLTKLTDPQKRTTTRKYDAANRLLEVSYSDGKTPTVKYEYTADGLRSKMVDGTGTTNYEYDQLDRLTATKDGHGNTVGYEYDLANEPTKITYPNTKSVTRTYDSAGRLKSVADWLEHTTKFAYDADSDLKATVFPSGTGNEDTYAYDETDAMKEVKMLKGSETLAALVYTHSKDGLVTKATTKGLPGEEGPTFGYDKNNRITKGATVAYKYDEANDPTTIGSATYSYDAADELEKKTVSKATAATYTYDELGERTKTTPASGPATSYGYDQAGNLTSVTRPKEGETPAIADTYAYNGDGLRTSQTISSTTTYMAWDLAETLPLILNDGTNSYIYGPGGLPVEQINSETPTYVHHDQQGSTRLLTNSAGENIASTTYDAYGNILAKKGTATTPLGYDGQYTDSDTGLIYLRARYYDPATAQFMSVDPKVEETNAVYEYAKDDPLTNSDPTGTEPLGAGILGAQELAVLGRGLRQLAGYFYLGQAAVEIGFKEAGEALGVAPGAYADFLLKWGLYFEKVAASLAHARPGAADAYYVIEHGLTVDGLAFPTKFGTAYAWYRGRNKSGAELFWAGSYGWLWKIHPNVP